MVLLVSVLGIGCSEERKREAARIAAELDAKERGEVLPPETTVVDTTSELVSSQDEALSMQTAGESLAVPDTAAQIEAAIQEKLGQQTEQSGAQSEVVAPAVTPQTMPPVLHDGFTVQVESSPLQSYIEQQVQVFKDRGYDAYIGSVTKEDKTYYRVRVGKFADRAEAVRVSAEINSMYNLQSWVDQASW